MQRHILICAWVFLFSCAYGQQLEIVEYYFGSDPGIGMGTAVSFDATEDTTLNISPSIIELTPGMHQLSMRGRDTNGVWSHINSATILINPLIASISSGEYFIDTEPGIGNATPIVFPTATDISNHPLGINIQPLNTGLHTLFIRALDDSGKLSLTQSFHFVKFSVATQNIIGVEYFIDDDPGPGNGTSVPLTPDVDIADFALPVNIEPLSLGLHSFNIRSLDSSKKPSLIQSIHFVKFEIADHDITEIEYFIDDDPGIANGTAVTITAQPDISGLAFNVDLNALSTGLHEIYIRSRSGSGAWSITEIWPFLFIKSTQLSNIIGGEYFIDNDPGFGNATNININNPGTQLTKTFPINITALNAGYHQLHLRLRDSLLNWSHTSLHPFVKIDASPDISKLEYYFDADPGIGNGTTVPLTNAQDISGHIFSPDISALNHGLHTLYARGFDERGETSITERIPIFKPRDLPDIVKVEYSFDMDPGIGQATPSSLPAGADIAQWAFPMDISGLATGVHLLYTRSQNAQDEWSQTHAQFFVIPENRPEIIAFEFFINDDPGFSLAMPVDTVMPAQDIIDYALSIDLGSIPEAPLALDSLGLRSVNSAGHWSLTEIIGYEVDPLSLALIDFRARIQNDKIRLEWKTQNEFNVSHFVVEKLDVRNTVFQEIAEVAAENSSIANYFTYDKSPTVGNNVYRLRMHDEDGIIKYSHLVTVHWDAHFFATVFPTPAVDYARVQFTTGMSVAYDVSLVEVQGKTVDTQRVIGSGGTAILTIDVRGVEAGLYYVVIAGDGNLVTLPLSVIK